MASKTKIILSIFTVLVGTAVLLEAVLVYPYLQNTLGIAIIITGVAAFLLSLSAAVALDHSVGGYECRKCGHCFKPTLGAYIWGIHTIRTRRLRCPKCGETSFCKRKLNLGETK